MVKRSLLLSLFLTLSSSAQSLEDSFKGGKVSGNLRAFWYDGDRELRIDRTALTVGGILSYKTAPYEGLSGGVSFFSSNAITSLTHMPESGQTQNLNLDGTSINTLGEAYLRYSSHSTMITIGRQRLNLPLTNDYYNRMLPNSFEALNIENRSIPEITLKAAYITGWKYKASDSFVSPTDTFGIHRDIAVFGGAYTPIDSLKIECYDTYVKDVMHAPYLQIIDDTIHTFSTGAVFSGALQYLNERSSGRGLLGEIDTYLFGLRGTITQGPWSLSTLYTHVGHQSLLGTGGRYERMGWGAFLTYTDLQIDGESENAGSNAYGGVLMFRPDKRFEISGKYMHIDQSDTIQSNPEALCQSPRPDSDEYNIDATYQSPHHWQIRTRLARIDYKSEGLYKANAFDESNIRIIADYFF